MCIFNFLKTKKVSKKNQTKTKQQWHCGYCGMSLLSDDWMCTACGGTPIDQFGNSK